MSGTPRRDPAAVLPRVAAQVLVIAVSLQATACQDASRGVAAEPRGRSASLTESPVPPGGLALGAPLFGLDAAPDGSLLAGLGSGVVEIRAG